MFHVGFTPDYSPSNALSAKSETLIGAIAELLKSLDIVFGPEEWYVQHVLLACYEAVKNMAEDKTAKASWTDMGCEDDAFSIDIFTHEEAKYVRHDGEKWLAPHGAVGFVADPLHEQWLYDQSEIGDWDNVLIPQAVYAAGPGPADAVAVEVGQTGQTVLLQTAIDALEDDAQPAISNEQMKDIIANADHLQMMVIRRQYADIYGALCDDGFNVDIQSVMVVVDQLASSDPFFVRLAKDLADTAEAAQLQLTDGYAGAGHYDHHQD